MKYLFPALFYGAIIIVLVALTIALLSSCSKAGAVMTPEIEQNIYTSDCQSVTNYRDRYDSNWKYLYTDIVGHWCNVCDSDFGLLTRYKAMEGKKYLLCVGQYDSIYYKVGPDKCK